MSHRHGTGRSGIRVSTASGYRMPPLHPHPRAVPEPEHQPRTVTTTTAAKCSATPPGPSRALLNYHENASSQCSSKSVPYKWLLGRARSAAGADPDAITAVVTAVAGYFTWQAQLPAIQGLPTVRAFQAAQGEQARAWLRRRTGWR